MPTAAVQTILCIRSSSGIDAGVFEAFAQLPLKIVPSEIADVLETLRALPGVIEAIDAARADPDNLYLTLVTNSGRKNAVWPPTGVEVKMLPDQSVAPHIAIEFDTSQNLSLFEEDVVSADDHLGSVTMFASEQGEGEIARLASSPVEGSAYYVTYRVD